MEEDNKKIRTFINYGTEFDKIVDLNIDENEEFESIKDFQKALKSSFTIINKRKIRRNNKLKIINTNEKGEIYVDDSVMVSLLYYLQDLYKQCVTGKEVDYLHNEIEELDKHIVKGTKYYIRFQESLENLKDEDEDEDEDEED